MFSKLQVWILASCTLAAAVVFAVCELRPAPPLLHIVAPSSDSPVDSGHAQDQPPAGSAPDAPPKTEPKFNSASIITNGNESDDKTIGAVMEKVANSFKAGDCSPAIDVMYTPIMEKLGGREKAIEAAKAVIGQMKEQGITVISWNAKKPYIYLAGNSHKYVIVPYEMESTDSRKTLKQTGYQLGIKTPNSGWQFVSGDQLSPEILAQFFPDFPKDFELPEPQRSWE